MHLPLPILQFLALLLSSTTLAAKRPKPPSAVPTREQIEAGRVEGRCSAPPQTNKDWATISTCLCQRPDDPETRTYYHQLEYYNLHLNATFLSATTHIDTIHYNAWTVTRTISFCRDFPRVPADDILTDKLCFTDHTEQWPCTALIKQRDTGTYLFGDRPMIHWNRQKRGFGPCNRADQGVVYLDAYQTDSRCRALCNNFEMEMILGEPTAEEQAVGVLTRLDVMCPGCR